jgi:uncharacterized protein
MNATSSSITHTSAENPLVMAALALVIIGGLNWGSVGFFNVDLVARIFGDFTMLSRSVYVLVGLSAIVVIARFANLIRLSKSIRR